MLMSDLVLWAAVVVLAAALVATWVVMAPMVRQQGRLLVRLEALEERLAGSAPGHSAVHAAPQGMNVGAEFPAFRLPDLTGRVVGLEDFRGKRVLAVHWNPGCGFCEQIAPELARLHPALRKRNTELVLVSHGDVESNRRLASASGLDCPIVLQPEEHSLEPFSRLGTPVAYLIDKDGRVAEPLVVGANDVPELARDAAAGRKKLHIERAITESRIVREGIKPGTPAPSFTLSDLEGRTVSVEDYRGRRLLVVFSDPQCGPCDALAPELARIGRENVEGHPALLMVSRGSPEDNRRKVAEHGIDFPVVIQPGWNVSKAYGIFATPVGFLIDEEGVVEKEVAKGADEILTLARDSTKLQGGQLAAN